MTSKAYRQAHKEKISEKRKAYYQAHKEQEDMKHKAYTHQPHVRKKTAERNKAWREANSEHKKQYDKAYYQKHKERIIQQTRTYYLGKMYDLTPKEKKVLYASQYGKCAICERDYSESELVVDHCHKTGKVRGLLCNPCNLAIGFLQDRPTMLYKAARYIINHQESENVS